MLETSLHLLVVEDDDSHFELIRQHLHRAAGDSISLHHVSNLKDGLACFNGGGGRFDAVLTDLNLPDSRGVETFRAIRLRAGRTPVIALTSESMTSDGVALMQEGAHDFLPKVKLDSELLLRSVICAVERQRLSRAEWELHEQAGQMEIARKIQTSILPEELPEWPELDVAAKSIPADQVGGDYFDFIAMDSGDYLVAIGDATGHGPGAALIMAMAAASLRTLTAIYSDLGKILQCINRLLCNETPDFAFMTFCLLRFSPSSNRLYWSNAGHLEPLLLRAGQDTPVSLPSHDDHLPVGLMSTVQYQETSLSLQSDDLIYTVTDGLTEARNSGNELFGSDRLHAVVKSQRLKCVESIVSSICAAATVWRAGQISDDDETCAAMRWNG